MWLFTEYGFFSVVAHRELPDQVMVRARTAQDIQALVMRLPRPKPKVVRTPDADYAFRVTVKRTALSEVLIDLMVGARDSIEYDNFKGAVEKRDPGRAALYHGVWAQLLKLQKG